MSPDSRCSLSIIITFMDKTPPLIISCYSLKHGKGYSEIGTVLSKIKCFCVVYHQIVICAIHCHESRACKNGFRNILCDWRSAYTDFRVTHNRSMMSVLRFILNLSVLNTISEVQSEYEIVIEDYITSCCLFDLILS